jgi:hypothetical protein
MTIYVDDISGIVDPIDDSFDEDGTTENLRSLRDDIDIDVRTIERLVKQLEEWADEARERVCSIDYELYQREAAATESNESEAVQTEVVG